MYNKLINSDIPKNPTEGRHLLKGSELNLGDDECNQCQVLVKFGRSNVNPFKMSVRLCPFRLQEDLGQIHQSLLLQSELNLMNT